MLQLRDAGKGVLISSHILTEISGFCNKAAIMERGKLVMFGTIAELGQKIVRRKMSVKWRGPDEKALPLLKNAQPGEKSEVAGWMARRLILPAARTRLDELLKISSCKACAWPNGAAPAMTWSKFSCNPEPRI